MDRDADVIPSSPSASSASSSDLDTESTGSFFPDRSTSLGTLMGVAFADAAARPPARLPSRNEHGGGRRTEARAMEMRRQRQTRRGGRGGWWRLCRGDEGPTSLGEFLQVERRMGSGGAAAVGAGPLFEDGRVLPPAAARERQRQRAGESAPSLVRLPVLLTGICSGGEG